MSQGGSLTYTPPSRLGSKLKTLPPPQIKILGPPPPRPSRPCEHVCTRWRLICLAAASGYRNPVVRPSTCDADAIPICAQHKMMGGSMMDLKTERAWASTRYTPIIPVMDWLPSQNFCPLEIFVMRVSVVQGLRRQEC